MKYVVVYERAGDGSWSARAVDLPVYTVAGSREDAEREIRDAIRLHLDELRRRGESPPPIVSGIVDVA